jgi:hypothetical protein
VTLPVTLAPPLFSWLRSKSSIWTEWKLARAEYVDARELDAEGKAYIRENFNQRTIGTIYEKRLQKIEVA